MTQGANELSSHFLSCLFTNKVKGEDVIYLPYIFQIHKQDLSEFCGPCFHMLGQHDSKEECLPKMRK
jgi:hypothetical protein